MFSAARKERDLSSRIAGLCRTLHGDFQELFTACVHEDNSPINTCISLSKANAFAITLRRINDTDFSYSAFVAYTLYVKDVLTKSVFAMARLNSTLR